MSPHRPPASGRPRDRRQPRHRRRHRVELARDGFDVAITAIDERRRSARCDQNASARALAFRSDLSDLGGPRPRDRRGHRLGRRHRVPGEQRRHRLAAPRRPARRSARGLRQGARRQPAGHLLLHAGGRAPDGGNAGIGPAFDRHRVFGQRRAWPRSSAANTACRRPVWACWPSCSRFGWRRWASRVFDVRPGVIRTPMTEGVSGKYDQLHRRRPGADGTLGLPRGRGARGRRRWPEGDSPSRPAR